MNIKYIFLNWINTNKKIEIDKRIRTNFKRKKEEVVNKFYLSL